MKTVKRKEKVCYKSHSCQRFCSLPSWAGYGLHEEGIRSVGS